MAILKLEPYCHQHPPLPTRLPACTPRRVEVGFDYVVAAELPPEPAETSAEPSAERSPISACNVANSEQEKRAPAAAISPGTEDEEEQGTLAKVDGKVDGEGGEREGKREEGGTAEREGGVEVGEPADSETAPLTGATKAEVEVEADASR